MRSETDKFWFPSLNLVMKTEDGHRWHKNGSKRVRHEDEYLRKEFYKCALSAESKCNAKMTLECIPDENPVIRLIGQHNHSPRPARNRGPPGRDLQQPIFKPSQSDMMDKLLFHAELQRQKMDQLSHKLSEAAEGQTDKSAKLSRQISEMTEMAYNASSHQRDILAELSERLNVLLKVLEMQQKSIDLLWEKQKQTGDSLAIQQHIILGFASKMDDVLGQLKQQNSKLTLMQNDVSRSRAMQDWNTTASSSLDSAFLSL